ncbi:DUF768 domain-containing protein [Mesorhizobium sp. NZP2077]|nr:DUF768 domain-containing protein [Mesorhizobium sp. NZP2077]QKD18980.1 DUF768 domain-containing protein [Mesorhizobium sp. NZP2077]
MSTRGINFLDRSLANNVPQTTKALPRPAR